MGSDVNILPCPFCGNADIHAEEVAPAVYAVCCPECSAIGPMWHGEQDAAWPDLEALASNATPEQARRAWERRI